MAIEIVSSVRSHRESIIVDVSMRTQVTVAIAIAVAVSYMTSSNVRCNQWPVVTLASDHFVCWSADFKWKWMSTECSQPASQQSRSCSNFFSQFFPPPSSVQIFFRSFFPLRRVMKTGSSARAGCFVKIFFFCFFGWWYFIWSVDDNWWVSNLGDQLLIYRDPNPNHRILTTETSTFLRAF